jgi:hypothetical protein
MTDILEDREPLRVLGLQTNGEAQCADAQERRAWLLVIACTALVVFAQWGLQL